MSATPSWGHVLEGGNQLKLLQNGAEFFPALLREIEAATKTIRIETYIFERDDIGQSVEKALIAAASRGVAVRLLVDAMGSRAFVRDGLEALCAAGVEARAFNAARTWFSITRGRLRRLHRKVAVFDSEVAFVGGINVISDFAPPNGEAPQYDFSVRIVGPLVATIERNSWGVWLASFSYYKRKSIAGAPTFVQPNASAGEDKAGFVFRDNGANRRAIERQLLAAIGQARESIVLANAYFLPGHRLRVALRAAAQRGVKITLVLQGHTDHVFLRAATRYLYARFLKSNIYIAEYERAMLHAKVCVVDDRWATVGSSNLDPFSLLLAREANVVTTAPRVIAELSASLGAAVMHASASVAPTLWAQRPLYEKVKSAIAYAMIRAVMSVSGLGGRLGA